MNIKTKVRRLSDGDSIELVAVESKNGIKKGTPVAGMSIGMYEEFVKMFGRDPEYDELTGIIHELERRHKLDLRQEKFEIYR